MDTVGLKRGVLDVVRPGLRRAAYGLSVSSDLFCEGWLGLSAGSDVSLECNDAVSRPAVDWSRLGPAGHAKSDWCWYVRGRGGKRVVGIGWSGFALTRRALPRRYDRACGENGYGKC